MFGALIFVLPCFAFAQTVRDEHLVRLNGAAEVWRIEWRAKPKPFCHAGGSMWYTCPCNGFAYGEAGKADLVRIKDRREIERLPLEPLFDEPFTDSVGLAILPRWPVLASDHDDPESAALESRASGRQQVPILSFADYDQDGVASEFFLQTWAAPCGKHMGVVVGISAANPRLHVFASVDRPAKPLVLQDRAWQALRDSHGDVRVTTWTCGDHGADTETEVELVATQAGIRARKREFECRENGSRGRMISEGPW
jgi:hypothetical protein